MFNVLHTIYLILTWILWLYSLFIVIDAILSWVPMLKQSLIGQWLDKIVDPYLRLFRRGPLAKLAYSTGIDVSPVIALLILYFVQNYILMWIFELLLRMIS